MSIFKLLCVLVLTIFYNDYHSNNYLNFYKYENKNKILSSHIINLDLPPEERWNKVIEIYKIPMEKAFKIIKKKSFIFTPIINNIRKGIKKGNGWSEENIREMKGIAQYTNTSYDIIETINLFYEWSPGCTSIVAQKYDNSSILHARNYDMPLSILSELVLELEFIKDGKTIYKGNGFAGYIGLTTAMKPGDFSISANSRFQGGVFGKYNFFQKMNYFDIIKAAKNGGKPVGVFLRSLVEEQKRYVDVIDILKKQVLINIGYYIVAGTKYGEGTVITRDRFGVDNSHGKEEGIWELSSPKYWWRLETNFDHWWLAFDRRRYVANKKMEEIGYKNVDLKTMKEVLETKPVLARDTIFTTLMNPKTGEYSTILR